MFYVTKLLYTHLFMVHSYSCVITIWCNVYEMYLCKVLERRSVSPSRTFPFQSSSTLLLLAVLCWAIFLVTFLPTPSNILRRYLSWSLHSAGILPKYIVPKLSSLFENPEFILVSSQQDWIAGQFQKIWKRSADKLPHCVLQCPDSSQPFCENFLIS